MSLNDEILRATGGPTINDGLSAWYSRTDTETLNDAAVRWLLAQPATTSGTLNDLWFEFLRASGFTGTLIDMKLQYWTAQP